MNNFKFIILILILFFITISLSGCYNNVDLTELAVATALGFDRADQGHIKVTVQIVKPGVMKARTQGSEEEPVWVFSATGETVFSAIRNLLTTVNRKVFFSHLQLIVISEEIASEGIIDLLDLLERDQEIKRTATILLARGISAEEILQAKTELENIPAIHISSLVDNVDALAKSRKIILIDLLKSFNLSGKAATIGTIQKSIGKTERENNQKKNSNDGQESKDKNELQVKDLSVTGAAVFKRDKLIGYLDEFETRGLLFVLDEIEGGVINVNNPQEEEKMVAFEIVNSSTELDVDINEENTRLFVKVKAEGRLADQQGRGDLTTPEMVEKIENSVARVIEINIRQVVDKAQKEYQLDYFGFSEILYKDHLSYWKKVENDWSNIFSQLPIDIEVEWKTSSSSLINKSSEAR
ncbi:MAG: Ger(x)C family spore germination protein [bacterium]